MNIKQDRIKEILELSKKYGFSEITIEKLIDDKYDEPRLHDFVWMLRDNLPENLINFVVDNNYNNIDVRVITKCYYSDEIDNKTLYSSVQNNDIESIKDLLNQIDAQRDNFHYSLLHNDLFCRDINVEKFMMNNKLIYIRHEFNWHTYASRLVLCGENGSLYFPMPEIPLIGGCWSNFVAQRMLNGQMYLQFVFRTAKASLDFINEVNNLNCKIIPCDNCFYAPYLYFYRNEDGRIDSGFADNTKKVYMDYLTKEYPEAYNWLQNRKDGEYFYDHFYVKHIPVVQ